MRASAKRELHRLHPTLARSDHDRPKQTVVNKLGEAERPLAYRQRRSPGASPRHGGELDIKPKMHHVAIADDVVATFDGLLAGFATLGFTAVLDQVFPPDHLGLDEAALEVSVNDA